VTDTKGFAVNKVTDVDEGELLLVRGGTDKMSTTLGPGVPMATRPTLGGGSRVQKHQVLVSEGAGLPPSPFMRRQFTAQQAIQTHSVEKEAVIRGRQNSTQAMTLEVEAMAREQRMRGLQGVSTVKPFTIADKDLQRRDYYSQQRRQTAPGLGRFGH